MHDATVQEDYGRDLIFNPSLDSRCWNGVGVDVFVRR